jgi:phosphoribosyl 1,2-cyclic phosphodiesterase
MPQRMDIIFMGTGSSSGTPLIRCAMENNKDCVACATALADPESKNNRGNPSILIKLHSDISSSPGVNTESHRNILIDVGKTFKRAALKWFPKFGITDLDAVILTHEHAGITNLFNSTKTKRIVPCDDGWIKQMRSSGLTIFEKLR